MDGKTSQDNTLLSLESRSPGFFFALHHINFRMSLLFVCMGQVRLITKWILFCRAGSLPCCLHQVPPVGEPHDIASDFSWADFFVRAHCIPLHTLPLLPGSKMKQLQLLQQPRTATKTYFKSRRFARCLEGGLQGTNHTTTLGCCTSTSFMPYCSWGRREKGLCN